MTMKQIYRVPFERNSDRVKEMRYQYIVNDCLNQEKNLIKRMQAQPSDSQETVTLETVKTQTKLSCNTNHCSEGDRMRHPSEDFSVSNIRYFSRHKGEVNCCAFSPDCQFLLTCCDDGRLYLWNATSAKHLATVSRHSGPVKSCVFSPDGQLFASASHDCTVRIWCSSSTNCTHILTAHTRSVETVSFSPDGQWLLSGGWDNRALLWRVHSGEMVEELRGHTAAVQSSAFSSDSQCVATGSWDRSVRVWKLHDEKQAVTLQGHLGNVACLCFSVTGMLASGSWDGTVRVWLPMRHACLFVLGGCERVWVRSLAFSRDGRVLASAAEGDMVRIWDTTTGACLKRLQGHKDSAFGCVFSPGGELLVSGSEQLGEEEDEEHRAEERSEVRDGGVQTESRTIKMTAIPPHY